MESGTPLPSLVIDDEMLLGILLGYGEESALAFKEMVDNHTERFAPPPTDYYQCIHLKQPIGCKIAPVVFMGDPHSKEVKKIRSVYEQELETFWETYKASDDPLKMVLQRLCKVS